MPKKNILVIAALFSIALFSHFTWPESDGYSAKNQMILSDNKNLSKADDNEPILSAINEQHDLSSTLLIDSIVSIVQSYYVDQERIDNFSILNLTLESLKASGYIKRIDQNKEVTKILVDDTTYTFYSPEKLPYNQLIASLVGVSSVINMQTDVPKKTDVQKQNMYQASESANIVLNSLLKALDAHSGILSEESYKELKQGTEGTFGGLGVLVGIRDQTLTVIKPISNSPASRYGIKKDDKILSIDGVETFGFTLDQLVEYMRGEPGTSVNLSLLRKGADSVNQVVLKREVIQVDSVVSKTIPYENGQLLYMSIESFSSRTAKEVLDAMNKHRSKYKSMAGVVLDLRSNPGGLLDQAVLVADLFLEKGAIVSTKGLRREVEHAGKGHHETDFPVVALINSDSASASEIVVGALQDHNRAVVIGQPSFGKGSVQTVFELPGEKALKLTIARYYTPSGRTIQNIGITPDIWVQPLYEFEKNENLLGYNRYRNEAFLKNHLNNKIRDPKYQAPLGAGTFKSFYLVNPESDFEQGDLATDREVGLAVKLLSKVKSIYVSDLPPSAQRASHWLALASKEMKQSISSWNQKTSEYLVGKHKLDWQEQIDLSLEEKVKFTNVSIKEKAVLSGNDLLIDYVIDNQSGGAINQVSIFARSEGYMIDTREFLIGSLKPNGKTTGQLKLSIPNYVRKGDYMLDLGLAISGQPVQVPMKRIEFQIEERKLSKLVSKVDLIDEVGGTREGILESDEDAFLKVEIFNDSDVDATDVNVRVLNLAGTQVKIDSSFKTVKKILAGKKEQVLIKLKGSKSIKNIDLRFGLSVESQDLFSSVREKISIKGLPADGGSKSALAH